MTKLKDLEKTDRELLMRGETNGLSTEGKIYFENLPPDKQEILRGFKVGVPFKTPSLTSTKPPKETIFDAEDINFSTLLQAGVPEKKQDIISILSKEIGRKVEYNPSENTYTFTDQSGRKQRVIPKFTSKPFENIAFKLTDILEELPSIATGVATAPLMLTGPAGTYLSTVATGAAGAISDAIRQLAANQVLNKDRGIDIKQVATQGLLDSAGQLGGKLITKLLDRNVAKDIGLLNTEDVSRLKTLSERFGINLTPAELTNLPSLKSQQKVLTNIVGSSDPMQKFYNIRQPQNLSAIDEILRKISPSGGDPYTATRKVKKAVEAARVGKVAERLRATNPIYEEAFANAKPVDVREVVSQINNLLKTVPKTSSQAKVLNRIKDLMVIKTKTKNAQGKEIIKEIPDTNLGRLQRAKFEIDVMKTEPSNVSLMNVINRDIESIENNLLSAMGKNNPKYIEANKKFEELSKSIDEFDEKFLNVERVSDQNITTLMNKLIGGREPEQIEVAKNYIKNFDPTAWKQLKRAWIASILEKTEDVTADESVDLGARFASKTFNKPSVRKRLQAALEPEEFQAFSDLAEVLTASGRVKKMGSDTAYNIREIDEMQGTKVGSFLKTDVTAPLKELGNYIDKIRFEENAKNIANIITSPDGMKRIKELQQLQPNDARFIAGASQLFSAFLN